jgi:hypothetical protein
MFPVATFAVALQNAWPLQEMTVSDAFCLPGREQIRVREPRGGSYTNLFLPISARFLISYQFFRLTAAAPGYRSYIGFNFGFKIKNI